MTQIDEPNLPIGKITRNMVCGEYVYKQDIEPIAPKIEPKDDITN